MIFIASDNPGAASCESCELALATYSAVDEDRAFLVCERCVPKLTRIPAQVGP